MRARLGLCAILNLVLLALFLVLDNVPGIHPPLFLFKLYVFIARNQLAGPLALASGFYALAFGACFVKSESSPKQL